MLTKSRSTAIFFFDVIILYACFFGVYFHYKGSVAIPLNALLLMLFVAVMRFIYLVSTRQLVRQGFQQRSILLIGGGRVAEKAINQLFAARGLGYRLYGVLADHYHESLPKGFYLGKLDRFKEMVRSGLVDEVIIALPLRMEDQIIRMVESCEYEGIRVRIVPDFFRIIPNKAVLEKIGELPLIGIRIEPLSLLKFRVLKRSFDIIFSLLVLIILSPIFLALAIIIKLTSPGPVFFKQEHIGTNNMKFDLYKFRSMTIQDKKASDTIWTTPNDSRVTSIGRFMRKTNLDEFPQFWNVLIGNMSVVGPRPEREYFVEKFKKEISSYKIRHLVKSGITGWA